MDNMQIFLEQMKIEMAKQTKDIITRIDEKLAPLTQEKSENIYLKEKSLFCILREKITVMEKNSRANNLIIYGPKEDEQSPSEILINAGNMGGGGGGGSSRRDDSGAVTTVRDGGRGKRGGDNRRQNFMDNNYTTRSRPTIDASKFRAPAAPKSLVDVRLAPTQWNLGASGAKPQQIQAAPNIIRRNQYSVHGNTQGNPTSLRASGGGRSVSVGVARPGSRRSPAPAPTAPEASAPAPATAPAPTPAPVVPQEPLSDDMMKNALKYTIDNISFMNPDDDELAEVKQLFPPKYHAAVIDEFLNLALEKNVKQVSMIAKSLFHLVATNTVAPEYFIEGIKETLEFGPDLFIDIPMLYNNLGKILAPHIEKKHITLEKTFDLSESVILANQGHLLLKAIIHNLNESMGPTFVKSKWLESGLQLSQWMPEEQVNKWIADNKFEFLEGDSQACDETAKLLTPAETQTRLLQLMNSDENCDYVKGWVQDKLGKASNEDWLMRALIQAICAHALSGNESRDVAHFNQDRMSKYASLIHEFGDSKQSREANCLFGIQQLIHRLEHPQGLTLEIFQYLHEQDLITLEGFLAWEQCETEPEGKGVMLKALMSFFTNIRGGQ